MDINIIATRQTSATRRPFFIALFLSALLHLAVVLLLPQIKPDSSQYQERPTRVRLVDPSTLKAKTKPPIEPQEKQNIFEPDQTVKETSTEKVTSQRKAQADQKVLIEQAPKGRDERDLPAVRQQVTPKSQAARPEVSTKNIQEQKSEPLPQSTPTEQPKPADERRVSNKAEQLPTSPTRTKPPLTREQLLPNLSTLDRAIGSQQGQQQKIKRRDDITAGDEVWLNLEHDLLVSFFRRFRNQIEGVWNYPSKAAQSGLQGTLQLLIIVDKGGELINVELKRSSGYDILDYEAIEAIYRAAPFGPLSKHYEHEQLKIRANFRYTISNRYIYGRNE